MAPEMPPEVSLSEMPTPQQSALADLATDLIEDLQEAFTSGYISPLLLARDLDGNEVSRAVFSHDGSAQVNDLEIAEAAEENVESGSLFGLLRVDLDQLKIVLWSRDRTDAAIVWVEISDDGELEPVLKLQPLDPTPRDQLTSREVEPGMILCRIGVFLGEDEGEDTGQPSVAQRAEAEAERDRGTSEIINAAYERLNDDAEKAKVVTDIPEHLMLDEGSFWAHSEPPAASSPDLDYQQRAAELLPQLEQKPESFVCARYIAGERIYLLGVATDAISASVALVSFELLEAGQLSEYQTEDCQFLAGELGNSRPDPSDPTDLFSRLDGSRMPRQRGRDEDLGRAVSQSDVLIFLDRQQGEDQPVSIVGSFVHGLDKVPDDLPSVRAALSVAMLSMLQLPEIIFQSAQPDRSPVRDDPMIRYDIHKVEHKAVIKGLTELDDQAISAALDSTEPGYMLVIPVQSGDDKQSLFQIVFGPTELSLISGSRLAQYPMVSYYATEPGQSPKPDGPD